MLPTTLTVINKTSNYNILESESGSVFNNFSAVSTITLFLPEDVTNGTYYYFAVQAAQELRIDPVGGTIRIYSVPPAGKYIWANAAGESIMLISNGANEWYPLNRNGTWGREP